MKILVVEDDFICRKMLVRMLSEFGECDIATNGAEAGEAFRHSTEREGQAYDLVCMDIMMPEMDGQEALRQIRAIEDAQGLRGMAERAKIIMTTALGDMKTIFKAFHGLCDAYVTKPVVRERLLDEMRKLNLPGCGLKGVECQQ